MVGTIMRLAATSPADRPLRALIGVTVAFGGTLQLVDGFGPVSLYGLAWMSVLVLGGYALLFHVPLRSDLRLPVLFTSAGCLLLTWGTFHAGTAQKSLATITGLLTIPLMLLIALGTAGTYAGRRLERTLEIALFVQAALIVPKIVLYGTDGRSLSSRPFGLAAAVGFAWAIRNYPTLRHLLRDPRAWLLCGFAILSESRTAMAWIALSIIFVATMPDRRRNFSIGGAIYGTAVVVFGSAALLIVSQTARDRLFGVSGSLSSGISLSNRDSIWPDVWAAIRSGPFSVRGAGTSASFVTRVSNGEHGNAHNDYLRLAYEAGLVGLALFVLAGILMFAYARQLRSSDLPNRYGYSRAAMALIVGLAFTMFFTNVLTYISVIAPAVYLSSAAIVGLRTPDP